jgi:hypothetical protein
MKNNRSKAIVGLSLAVLIVLSTRFGGPSHGTDEIGRIISRTESLLASRRLKAFQELEDLMSPPSEVTDLGFSGTPIETESNVKQIQELSDEDISRIALAIQRGLVDDDPEVREAAAMAICSPNGPHPDVIRALTIGLNSNDPSVIWYVSQEALNHLPPLKDVIDSLISKLSDDAFSNSWTMFDLIKAYGVQAKPYEDQILDAILSSKSERTFKLYILYDLKLGKQAAEKLAEASAEFNREELAIAAVSLLEYPQLLKRLETKKPETATALQDQLSRLSVFMCEHHGSGHETLLWLAESEQLLPTTMALLGDERFISEIGRSEEAASEHRRTFLAGCKRACGGPVGEQLMVDADHPVEFRPKSAWPESDDRVQQVLVTEMGTSK